MPQQGCKWQCLQSNKIREKQSEQLPSRRYPNRAAGWERGMSERQEMRPPAQPALGRWDPPGSSGSLHWQKMQRMKRAEKALAEV